MVSAHSGRFENGLESIPFYFFSFFAHHFENKNKSIWQLAHRGDFCVFFFSERSESSPCSKPRQSVEENKRGWSALCTQHFWPLHLAVHCVRLQRMTSFVNVPKSIQVMYLQFNLNVWNPNWFRSKFGAGAFISHFIYFSMAVWHTFKAKKTVNCFALQFRGKKLLLRKAKMMSFDICIFFFCLSDFFSSKSKQNENVIHLHCQMTLSHANLLGCRCFFLFVPTSNWSEFMCLCVCLQSLICWSTSLGSLCLLVHLILKPVCRCHNTTYQYPWTEYSLSTFHPPHLSFSLGMCVKKNRITHTLNHYILHKNCHDNNSICRLAWNKTKTWKFLWLNMLQMDQ